MSNKKIELDEAVIALAASVTGRACELIKDGWVKGQMSRAIEGVKADFCIHGALDEAMGELGGGVKVNQDVQDLAVAFICDEAFGKMQSYSGGIPAAGYNDARERKHEEVVGVMERASERLWNLAVEQRHPSEPTWAPSKWAEVDVNSEEAQSFLNANLN